MSKIIRTEKPSVLPFYAAAAAGLVLCLALPVYQLWALALMLVGAAAAFLVARRVCPPQVIEREVPFHTGSGDVDQMLTDIQQKLDTLHALNDALPDPQLSAAMDRMERAGRSIVEVVEASPAKAKQIRRFANYYLPDAVHVLEQYAAMARQGVRGENAASVRTEVERNMGAIAAASRILNETPGSFMPAQFDNPNNALAHEKTTGPEIWKDLNGRVDFFVAGVGTGGTLTGTGRFLKKQNPNLKIIAVEPADSPLLSGGKAGPHGLQGIGANFIPAVLDRSLIDEVIPVTTQDACQTARRLAKLQGILPGISGGASLWAALEVAKRPQNAGKNIVTLLPDGGERYLSTELFE